VDVAVNIIVMGAGLNGLSTAMLLARDGHEVTVVERDRCAPPPTAQELWHGWERRGVRHFRLPHLMAPRWRQLVEQELPEVLVELQTLGGQRVNVLDLAQWPEAVRGGVRPGDERFDTIAARRPLVEAALAVVADRTPGVQVRRGIEVTGFTAAAPRTADVPQVTGVVTRGGSRFPADLVIDAGGRNSPTPRMLARVGAAAPFEDRRPDGFVYYCRHFRSRDGTLPPFRGMQHYPGISVSSGPCDAGIWAASFITSTRERQLGALRHRDGWDRAAALYPDVAALAAGEPVTEVEVTAMPDRYRRFIVDDRPVVTGLLVLGDAWACTNPSLGRGSSIGMLHACALRDVLRDVDADETEKLVWRFDEATQSSVAPWYTASLATDEHRLAELHATMIGAEYRPDDPGWSLARSVNLAALADPEVLRARLEVSALLRLPSQAYAQPHLRRRIETLAARQAPSRPAGVGRDELIGAVQERRTD
jgi:2-polyprenyl-6-methoxyphenol hydroxylase-like FAD-dependent oxidoreductase